MLSAFRQVTKTGCGTVSLGREQDGTVLLHLQT